MTDQEFLDLESEIAGAIRGSLEKRGMPFHSDLVNVYIHQVEPEHMPPMTVKSGGDAWANDRDGMDLLAFFQARTK